MESSARNGCHVAINAHLLSNQAGYRSAGVHQYIHYLTRHLGQADTHLRFTLLVGKGMAPPEAGLHVQPSRWDTSRIPSRVLWEQCVQPLALRRIGADLVHGPVFIGPLCAPCPVVLTIHDLGFIRFPRACRPAHRHYLTIMTRLSARRARRLIAVSEHTASEASSLLGVQRDRIDVVYHGVDPQFRPLPPDQVIDFRRRQGLPARFVLFVGTLEPRKNLLRLVDAFSRLADSRTLLVLVGGRGWKFDDLFSRAEDPDLKHRVVFPGYARQEELPLWYNAATAFVYPSLYEGFGLPVLEAMACGTPVLCSNASSLPEVAGSAALMFTPTDTEALSAQLYRLLSDSSLRRELRDRGLTRSRSFSWIKAAEETTLVYQRAIDGER